MSLDSHCSKVTTSSVRADAQGDGIVSSTDPRPGKTGIHLNFPHINCDCRIALAVREVVVQECSSRFPSIGSWEDIVDVSIYKQSGLRMIGSCKVDSEYTYQPMWRLATQQPPEVLDMSQKGAWQNMIKSTSIRTFSQQVSVTCLLLPPLGDDQPQRSPMVSACTDLGILEDIRPHLPTEYREVRWTNMKQAGDKFFVHTDCKFCLNVDREHTNSKIWFQLQYEGIYQKCFSNKRSHDRHMGVCTTFRSNMYPMPDSVRQVLWPGASQGPSKKPRVS